jgi:hypothetical protein
MESFVLKPNEVVKWAVDTNTPDGVSFDLGSDVEPHASMDEAVMGQNGPTLSGGASCCLLMPIYVVEHRLGLLIHLGWQDALNEDGAALIRQPFLRYTELAERPSIRVVFSEALHTTYPDQIDEARLFIMELLPTATVRDVIVSSPPAREMEGNLMGVEVRLNTRSGRLRIRDDYGRPQTINLSASSG